MFEPSISHDWDEETLEAKARWFQSLSVEQRMRTFDEMWEFAYANHPEMFSPSVDEILAQYADSPSRTVRVVTLS